MAMKLPNLLRAWAVIVLLAGVVQGVAALGVMQALGTGAAGMVTSLQGALNALPNAPRGGVNPGVVTAFTTGWGYLMCFWGVAAGVVAAALLWAAACALDLLQSTHAAVTRMARGGVPPRG